MLNKNISKILLIIIVCYSNIINAQPLTDELQKAVDNPRFMRLMFYNCENFFDTKHDTLKNDVEFLPEGQKNWSKYRYYTKVNQIYKVITAVGGWETPDLVGLCEVENKQVLLDLMYKTPLYKEKYKILHKESPDKRGIDVALLYKPESFKPIKTEFLKVTFTNGDNYPTRDILYTKGVIKTNDTLHVFINHWPSRWGGQLETEGKRMTVAKIVRNKVNDIFKENPNAYIFITGDLNDEPQDKSVTKTLNALHNLEAPKQSELYNLSYTLQHEYNLGTHKFHGHWGILDQLIISGGLLNNKGKITTSINQAHIFKANFLLEDDEAYLDKKPFRTYAGYRYLGGYSDHLPVFLDLIKQTKDKTK